MMGIMDAVLASVGERVLSAPEKVQNSIDRMTNLFARGHYAPIGLLSGGKDSSCALSMSLVAWSRACRRNPKLKSLPFIILSVDTKVEMPVKANYLKAEFRAYMDFAKDNGINLFIDTPSPNISSRWQGKVVGGSYRNFNVARTSGHKCAILWKINVVNQALKEWHKKLQPTGLKLLTIVGSRMDESNTRKQNLTNFGVKDGVVVEPSGATNFHSYYPVLNFTKEDIWNYLLMAEDSENAVFPGIKDGFFGTVELYNSLAGGECSIDMSNSSCAGSRDGCWQCYASPDEVIDEGIAKTNPHIAPLVEFRKFMLINDRNSNLRNYIQTQLDDNDLFVKYIPNGLCGAYLLKILEIGLTIQKREIERAARIKEQVELGTYISLGGNDPLIEPQFTIFAPEDIIFINYSWMVRGLQLEPNAAFKAYWRIMYKGEKVDIPSEYVLDRDFSDELTSRGRIYLGDIGSGLTRVPNEEHSKELSWQYDEAVCKFLLSEEVLEQWVNDKSDFLSSAQKLLDSGALSVPKGQLKALATRINIASVLYELNLNIAAYNGGKVDT
ncbi:phosphoadenosine phosphosulfate reductase family protein [Vibrio navarrensis]|uniref:phosphoadenosine phosphosulfate reductase domain-containing protein n=1 Tax=Vibrio navarrensis TaxID=29495 RepID=UPI0018DDFBF5|nr:phosphoadenosine phosphosulfate reductase family protein [Vibrio navarrensis]MBH9739898.1 hypothetical protein [Vibrio navarrensis]